MGRDGSARNLVSFAHRRTTRGLEPAAMRRRSHVPALRACAGWPLACSQTIDRLGRAAYSKIFRHGELPPGVAYGTESDRSCTGEPAHAGKANHSLFGRRPRTCRQGTNFVNLRDAGDPVEVAARYEQEGADELVFLDITASHEGRDIMLDVVRRTAEQIFMPLTVGGGIRTLDDIRALLSAGSDKVSINSAACRDP